MRDIMVQLGNNNGQSFRFSSAAVDILHEAGEDFLTNYFKVAAMMTEHGHRSTLMPVDLCAMEYLGALAGRDEAVLKVAKETASKER